MPAAPGVGEQERRCASVDTTLGARAGQRERREKILNELEPGLEALNHVEWRHTSACVMQTA